MNKLFRPVAILAIVMSMAFGTLGLAGCGSSAPTSSSASTTSTAGSTAASNDNAGNDDADDEQADCYGDDLPAKKSEN